MFKFKRTKKVVRSAFMIDAVKQQHNVLKNMLLMPFKAISRVRQESVDEEKVNKTLADNTLYNRCLKSLAYRFYLFSILFLFGTIYFIYLVIETHATWQAALMMLMINVILFLYVFRYHMWLTQARHKLKQFSLTEYLQLLASNSLASRHQHDKNPIDNQQQQQNNNNQ